MNPLYKAYIAGEPKACGLFAHTREALFSRTWAGMAWGDGIAALINERQEASEPIRGDEIVIATGQQPGLFTGPLYTIYKAITTVKLAEQLRKNGVLCVPVFWVAGDDHDFAETQTAHFLTKRHQLLSLTYTPDTLDVSDMPMYRVPLDQQVHTLIDEAAQACRGSEYTREIRTYLHTSLEASGTMAEWFTTLMERLFEHTGLRLLCPWEKTARRAAIPVLAREIENPLASTRLLIERGAYMASIGFEAAIQRDERACNFFVEQDGRRRRVLFEKGHYHIAGNETPLTIDQMHGLLADTPELFSPNVALRPVVQQQLLPVAAYVAGPGEVAYWAQLQPLFDFFKTPMPVVYPRMQCLITSHKVNQFLHHYGFDSEAVRNDDDLLAKALRADAETPALDALSRLRPGFEQALENLICGISEHDSRYDVSRASARFRRDTLANLERLERRLLYTDKEKRTVIEARIDRLRTVIAPRRVPQERMLCVFSFVFEHGWPLIERMAKTLDTRIHGLQEIEL